MTHLSLLLSAPEGNYHTVTVIAKPEEMLQDSSSALRVAFGVRPLALPVQTHISRARVRRWVKEHERTSPANGLP